MRLRVRTLLAVVAAMALVLGLLVVPLVRLTAYPRAYREAAALLGTLHDRRPPEVAPPVWRCAVDITGTALANVFFSEGHAPYTSLVRFRAELAAKLDEGEPVGFDTLAWAWSRMGESGPHGRRYTRRMWPLLLDCLPPGTLPATLDAWEGRPSASRG